MCFLDACLPTPSPYRDKAVQGNNHTMVTLQEVQEMCAEIRSFRSNCANDDVTVLETSLLDCYGLLNLHHVSVLYMFDNLWILLSSYRTRVGKLYSKTMRIIFSTFVCKHVFSSYFIF